LKLEQTSPVAGAGIAEGAQRSAEARAAGNQ
jgi:hypothetical protein